MSRPDVDSSSMRGYTPGSSEFNAATTPEKKPEPVKHDVDSSSMRGFISKGPVPTR